MFTTAGFPSVIVPVLSIVKVVTLFKRSKASAFFTKTPFFAPLPTATITDIGVAKPRAHGQATINTAKALAIAKAIRFSLPKIHHAKKVTKAIIITVGTNIFEILSTTF